MAILSDTNHDQIIQWQYLLLINDLSSGILTSSTYSSA